MSLPFELGCEKRLKIKLVTLESQLHPEWSIVIEGKRVTHGFPGQLFRSFHSNEMANVGVLHYVAAVFIFGLFDEGERKLDINNSV